VLKGTFYMSPHSMLGLSQEPKQLERGLGPVGTRLRVVS
jgi:hypothetical protein